MQKQLFEVDEEVKNRRIELIGNDWYEKLSDLFETKEMYNVKTVLENERKNGYKVYPEPLQFFRAFKECRYNNVKVVIVGQDPYPNEHANGVAFATDLKVRPKSLQVIFDKLDKEVMIGKFLEGNNTLKHWCEQGVLLLNSRLSVRAGLVGSHANIGWENFIARTIITLNAFKNNLVFLAWGSVANKVIGSHITKSSHYYMYCEHPVAPIYRKSQGGDSTWNNNNCFINANIYLRDNNIQEINW